MQNKPYDDHQEDDVMRRINELCRLFKEELRRSCTEMGVPVGYRGLLFHLAQCDGRTQKELAQMTALKAATVSIALEKMERDGYVTRRKDEKDARAMRVFLTEKGFEIDRRIKGKIDALEKEFSSYLTPDERKTLIGLLGKIYDARCAIGGRGEKERREGT